MVVHKTDQANAWMEHLRRARAHLHQLSTLTRDEDFGQHLHAAAALELLTGKPGLASENLQRWMARQSSL
ncbi:MAG: hypothetical protein K0Q91_499 [Fibrobacteria bacterium]|jgi:hypothetical protein|nr:hypothetical protein [Fibrobacteria bacterium]